MAIYEMTKDTIQPISETKFSEVGISERGDLQRLLRERIDIISLDTLVVAEEFGQWEDSRRRIDLGPSYKWTRIIHRGDGEAYCRDADPAAFAAC